MATPVGCGKTVPAVCWGDNRYEQASPPKGERFVAVSGGSLHSCGIREDGTVVCWGYDNYGQVSPPR